MSAVGQQSRSRFETPAIGYGLLLALGLCWGVNWPAMKLAVEVLPVWHFRAACLTFGALTTLFLARVYGARLRVPRKEILPLIICACFNMVGWQLLTAYGLTLMDAGRASIIAFTMPLWASLLSILLLNERLTATRVAGLVLGLSGLAALLMPEMRAILAAPYGVLAILSAAMSWALGTVLTKRFSWSVSAATLSGWQLLTAALVVSVGALTWQSDAAWAESWSTGQLIGVIYAITIAIAFGHWAWFQIVRIFPAPVAAIGTMLVPLVGVFSGGLLLGEHIGPAELLALVLVISGLFCVLVLPGLRRERGLPKN